MDYKNTISKKIYFTWDNALRWCRVRGKWINYVYRIHVKPFNNNVMLSSSENKKKKTEAIKKLMSNDFHDSIRWDNYTLNPSNESKKEEELWKWVEAWVVWFSKNGKAFEEAIKSLRERDVSYADASEEFDKSFNINNIKLSKFILDRYGYF